MDVDLLDRFTQWALENGDIRVAILLGSHVADDSDSLSDFDVVLYTDNTDKYAHEDAWLERPQSVRPRAT